MNLSADARRSAVDRVLLESAELLLARARREIERRQGGGDPPDAPPENELAQVRDLERELHRVREQMATQRQAAQPAGLQASRFWETPGQEDS